MATAQSPNWTPIRTSAPADPLGDGSFLIAIFSIYIPPPLHMGQKRRLSVPSSDRWHLEMIGICALAIICSKVVIHKDRLC
jgi:hypothetical protein